MNAATQTQISARILAKIGAGMTLPQALDAICGKGSYERLAGQLYDELRAQ